MHNWPRMETSWCIRWWKPLLLLLRPHLRWPQSILVARVMVGFLGRFFCSSLLTSIAALRVRLGTVLAGTPNIDWSRFWCGPAQNGSSVCWRSAASLVRIDTGLVRFETWIVFVGRLPNWIAVEKRICSVRRFRKTLFWLAAEEPICCFDHSCFSMVTLRDWVAAGYYCGIAYVHYPLCGANCVLYEQFHSY